MAWNIRRMLMLLASPLFTSLISAATIPNNITLTERAYSVPAVPDPNDGLGRWPARGQPPFSNPIWYCFKDPRSAAMLRRLVLVASEKWRPALHPNSALVISMHPRINGEICPPNPGDLLVISYEGPTGNPKSTIGYDYKSNESGRHTLKFAGFSTEQINANRHPAILSMAHELGHVIGLAHEHQRPDRDHHINFKCNNLQGWFATEEKVRKVLHTVDSDVVSAEMDCVCTDPDVAEQYGFDGIRDYTLGPDIGTPFTSLTSDNNFDRNSIMIYSSWQGAEQDPTGDLEDAVLTVGVGDGEVEIFQGGNRDPKFAGPSEQDIAQVKQLYPRH